MAQAKVASYGAAAKDGAAIIERTRAIARLPARVSVPRFNAAGGARRTTRGGRKKKTSAALPWVTAPARANRRSRTDRAALAHQPTPRGSSTSEASGSRRGCRADGSRRHEGAEGCGEAQRGGVRGAPYDAREEGRRGEASVGRPEFFGDETAFAVERTRV